jgi:uncharacterized protein (TIGR02453 family)
MTFTGFSQSGITFLKDLAANNNKEWFEKNRNVYENHIMVPMRQLATMLGPVVKSIDNEIETSPTVNKTISKIYRDIRFSNDKSPFRTGLWLTFRRPNKVWGNIPEFYFYFTPEEYQYGMGFYSATPANMEKFRHNMNIQRDRFAQIAGFFNSRKDIEIGGEDYRKSIPNDLPDEFQEWYRKKNLYTSLVRKMDKSFYSPGLKDDIESFFRDTSGLYLFLIESTGL